MPHLSVCMPSNRPFATSRRAIETALTYCEAKDALLIVSDNSGDADKRSYWEGRSPRLTYLVDPGLDATRNFMTAIHSGKTSFVMPMGDDDELLFDPAVPPFDFASLPADYIGVRPITEVFIPESAAKRIKDFAIDGETPPERMLEYNRQAGGDNSTFYTAFRRKTYINLMELFARYHPTKGSYCDWAEVLTLFAFGKAAVDRGTIYRYSFEGWHEQAVIEQKVVNFFETAGLPGDSQKYNVLLLYLDVFVFVSSQMAPLSQESAAQAKSFLSGPFFNSFLHQVVENPSVYTATTRYLAEIAQEEKDVMGRFHIALMMTEQITDGLKDRYVAYYKAALEFSDAS